MSPAADIANMPISDYLKELGQRLEALPAESAPEVINLVLDLFQSRGTTGYLVWARVEPAVGTGENRVGFYPSSQLVDLLAAVRAGEFDPDALRRIIHGASNDGSECSDTTQTTQEAPRVKEPAA